MEWSELGSRDIDGQAEGTGANESMGADGELEGATDVPHPLPSPARKTTLLIRVTVGGLFADFAGPFSDAVAIADFDADQAWRGTGRRQSCATG